MIQSQYSIIYYKNNGAINHVYHFNNYNNNIIQYQIIYLRFFVS